MFQVLLLVSLSSCEDFIDWKTEDLKSPSIPTHLQETIKKVQIDKKTISIGGDVNTFYQIASPPASVQKSGKVLLFLHGAAFSSQTWVDRVPTIATMAALGHEVIAIDLPGFSRSKTTGSVRDKGKYLLEVITNLTPEVKPVIITPSASGSFISAFLKHYSDEISGWVPVAPVGLSPRREFYQSLHVPTMIVYGA